MNRYGCWCALWVAYVAVAGTSLAEAPAWMARGPVVVNDDGGWCWFQDERALVIRDRLVVYGKETAPLLDFYRGHHRIDGTGTPEEVFGRIEKILNPR